MNQVAISSPESKQLHIFFLNFSLFSWGGVLVTFSTVLSLKVTTLDTFIFTDEMDGEEGDDEEELEREEEEEEEEEEEDEEEVDTTLLLIVVLQVVEKSNDPRESATDSGFPIALKYFPPIIWELSVADLCLPNLACRNCDLILEIGMMSIRLYCNCLWIRNIIEK